MEIKELQTVAAMLEQIEMIRFLYPNISYEKYEAYLTEMTSRNYTQVAVFENQTCVGLTGCWFGIKLWSGKYIEIDNFIVHPDYRGKSIGKLMTDFINQKAQDLDCSMIVLDAFTGNFDAHRFYYKQGYEPRGFHFIKMLDKEKLS
jgi:GNAT superfamily N-acetyltransferase